MWQVHRQQFRQSIKAGQRGRLGTVKKRDRKALKTRWESKWEHPDQHAKTTQKFLHMDLADEELKTLDGHQWLSNFILNAILKRDFGKLKHKTKHGSNPNNISVIPSTVYERIQGVSRGETPRHTVC
jgi:hypothetical protein